MPLKLKSAKAILKKTRVKREGGEKGKITALFLQFEGAVNVTNLKALLNTETPPVLHDDSKRKQPLWPAMGAFPSNVEYGGAKVDFCGTTLTDCIVRNFKIEAHEGDTIHVTFDVKAHPTKALVGTFETDLLGEIGKLSVDANTLLDPNPDGEGDDDEEEEDDQEELPLEEETED